MINPFFKNNGPFKISDILQQINLDDLKIDKDQEINDLIYKSKFTADKAFMDLSKTKMNPLMVKSFTVQMECAKQ